MTDEDFKAAQRKLQPKSCCKELMELRLAVLDYFNRDEGFTEILAKVRIRLNTDKTRWVLDEECTCNEKPTIERLKGQMP